MGFLTMGLIGSRLGLHSIDSYGIIQVVNAKIQTGEIKISRPPGHPLSENWVLPLVTRLTGADSLSPLGYSLYQLLGGVLCLGIFWLLLSELPIPPARRLLATACLAFSPWFLISSSDGEEFLWGMACVLAGVLVLSRLSKGNVRHPLAGWYLCVTFAAAASGYRIEFGAVAFLAIGVTLLFSDQSWQRRLGLAVFALLLLLVIWFPVLAHHGIAPPFAIHYTLKSRIGVGLYKIIFQTIGLIPFLLGLVVLFQIRRKFRILPSFRQNILTYWSFWLAAIFFVLFFNYPTKNVMVQPVVAFLILLSAVHAGQRTWTCLMIAFMALSLVHLDCFYNRHWTGLRFQPSIWAQSLETKPASMWPKVQASTRTAATGRHVLISLTLPWDLAWQKTHNGWQGVSDPKSEGVDLAEVYFTGQGIVAPRDLIDNPTQLTSYLQDGYDVWLDKDLYREEFSRYDLFADTPKTAVLHGIPCRIVDVK